MPGSRRVTQAVAPRPGRHSLPSSNTEVRGPAHQHAKFLIKLLPTKYTAVVFQNGYHKRIGFVVLYVNSKITYNIFIRTPDVFHTRTRQKQFSRFEIY